MNECDTLTGRKRLICRGEAGLPLNGPNSTNAYRTAWGFEPLCELPAVAAGSTTVSTAVSTVGEDPSAVRQSSVSQEPPLLIRGWNFAAALARWTLAGLPRRTQVEIEARLAICQACEFLKNNHCGKCGCACNEKNRLINKLALATERCPIGKWC
jgi:hypothetical protein